MTISIFKTTEYAALVLLMTGLCPSAPRAEPIDAKTPAPAVERIRPLIPDLVTLDGKEYGRGSLTHAFMQIAFSTYIMPNVFPEKTLEVSDLPHTRNSDNLSKEYPWLYEYMYRDHGTPPYVVINKWAKPIRVSIGYPNDLKPFETPHDPDYLVYSAGAGAGAGVPEVRQQVIETLQKTLPELSALTGLPVTFLPHDQETPTNFADIRIVLTSDFVVDDDLVTRRKEGALDIWETSFKKGSPRIAIASPGGHFKGSGPQRVSFRQRAESALLQTAVSFTPYSVAQVDGYFLPAANNEIGMAFCFISEGHPPEILRALVQECLVRSLGLPDAWYHAPLDKTASLLSLWNQDDTHSVVGVTSSGLTDFDRFMIKLLYDPAIKPGMTYKNIRESIFTNVVDHKEHAHD